MRRYFDFVNSKGLFAKLSSLVFEPKKINELLRDRNQTFLGVLRDTFKGKSVRSLVLGSSTPDNISTVQDFLANRVNVDIEKSGLFFLDRHPRSLYPHKRLADATPQLPKVHVLGGDVRFPPIRTHSFDIILSDYTANFLASEQDWKDFFQEIQAALSSEGHAVAQLDLYDDQSVRWIHGRDKALGIDMLYPSAETLRSLIEEARLEIAIADYRRSDTVVKLQDPSDASALKTAILVLKPSERETEPKMTQK